MTGTVLAAAVNLSGGTALTFFFPVGVFVVIGTALYLLFSRPHRRVPAPLISGRPGSQASGATASAPAGAEHAGGASAAAPPESTAAEVPGDEADSAVGSQAEGTTEAGTESGE